MPQLSQSQINKIKDFDTRTIFLQMYSQLALHNEVTGTNWIGVPTNSPQQPAAAVPPIGSLTVTAKNGVFAITAVPATESVNKKVYIEVSYSQSSSFEGDTTTLPVTTQQAQSVASPGTTAFWRARFSYDSNNWSGYYVQPSAVSSGLQSSAASENNTPLNQTNYAFVDSVSTGSAANVRIYGKAGVSTQYPSVKGSVETIQPAGVIINVPFNSNQVVALDEENNYAARATLPEVFPDNWTPIGAASVVGSAPLSLPTISPIISGGQILGYNVTFGGSGLTGPVTLALASVGGGTGATFGAQTIKNGVLISVAPGNPGQSYSGGTTVTVSGGTGSGAAGGGQTIGGNNGRLLYFDATTGS